MLIGLVGSYDVQYWHWHRLRLFEQPEARTENLTHAIRALLFAAMTLMVLHLDARGAWWPIYPALLSLEVINSLADVILEPASRRRMGGLPAAEYIVHIVLSILTGGALASIIWDSFPLFYEPSHLGLRTLPVPLVFRLAAYVSVVAAFGMFSFELRGFFRLGRPKSYGPERAIVSEQSVADDSAVGIVRINQ